MRENRYQRNVILRLRREFPRCVILKNDPDYLQGMLDLTVLLPGFWALFGLMGCIGLILLSKAFGHAGIMQREDYYDE